MYVHLTKASCKKKLCLTCHRNGTIKSITSIVENLNKAKLDENTGASSSYMSISHPSLIVAPGLVSSWACMRLRGINPPSDAD